MSRKRLGQIDPNAASRARDAAEQALVEKVSVEKAGTDPDTAPASSRRPVKGPPIAHMAAGVGQEIDAEIRRLKAELQTLTGKGAALDAAEAEGRVILAVDLDQIDTGHLTRDRRTLNREGEDWASLKASLQARGQQTPIEITDLGEGSTPRYGLISGLRRISALRELLIETGQERFALVLALIRPAQAIPDKLIAMIEENEVRAGISFFERGRIAALAVQEGIFDDADEAIETLFASSNRNRRYKIRCFVTLYDALGEQLLYPEAIGERLGIQLAKSIREQTGTDQMVAALDAHPDRSQTQELALLTRISGGDVPDADAAGAAPLASFKASWDGGNGMTIRARSKPGSQRVTLDIDGFDDIDAQALQKLVRWLGDEIDATTQPSRRDRIIAEKNRLVAQRGQSRGQRKKPTSH